MVAAGEELNVTHGAISRQIKQLEEVLGVKLFEGPKNRPQMTEAGRHMLPMLTSAFDQIDKAVNDVADTGAGIVTVSCPGTLMMRWLLPRLNSFNEAHPEIDVRVVASESVSDPNLSSHDIAMRLLDRPIVDEGDILHATLFEEVVGPILSRELNETLRISKPEDFLSTRLLLTRARPESWDEWFESAGIEPPPYDRRDEYQHLYFLYEAVLAGLGAGLLPWQLAGEDIVAGRLVAPLGFTDLGRSHAVLWRRDARIGPRTFVDWLLEEGAKMEPPPPD